MVKDRFFISCLLLSLMIPTAYADLPLTIEDLLTAERLKNLSIAVVAVSLMG